mmetsp:Transcript_46617/g.124596  ORF Transcript_46617/g.124596 Transcript_46617/m.124596 type:complete len:198 (-) Transcript_46617:346-939(-)
MAHMDSMSDLGLLGGGQGLFAGLLGDRDPFEEFSPEPVEGTLPGASSVQYSCQTFAQSTVVGPDGRPQTERFASSDVGNRAHGIREAHQAYSNSQSSVYKTGHERHLGGRAVKVSSQHNRETGEAQSRELFQGVDAAGRSTFEQEFGASAHHLPKRPRGRMSLQEQGADWVESLPALRDEGAGVGQASGTMPAGMEQ